MKVAMIVAHGKNGQIGLDNKLLWHIPEDFKKFKELTSGHTIIMGRNTFESLPGMLPNRYHIVITTRPMEENDMLETTESLEDALSIAELNGDEKVWIIGGARVYNEALQKGYIDEMCLSEVDYDGDADASLNPIDFPHFSLVEEEFYEEYTTEKGKKVPAWTFRKYIRKG